MWKTVINGKEVTGSYEELVIKTKKVISNEN
jgi:hypothetical protein